MKNVGFHWQLSFGNAELFLLRSSNMFLLIVNLSLYSGQYLKNWFARGALFIWSISRISILWPQFDKQFRGTWQHNNSNHTYQHVETFLQSYRNLIIREQWSLMTTLAQRADIWDLPPRRFLQVPLEELKAGHALLTLLGGGRQRFWQRRGPRYLWSSPVWYIHFLLVRLYKTVYSYTGLNVFLTWIGLSFASWSSTEWLNSFPRLSQSWRAVTSSQNLLQGKLPQYLPPLGTLMFLGTFQSCQASAHAPKNPCFVSISCLKGCNL